MTNILRFSELIKGVFDAVVALREIAKELHELNELIKGGYLR